jgi:mannose-6-phosphate isomerase-like protein (cupin superfamily)
MTDSGPVWTPKPWGGEWLLRCTDTYAVKILHLRSGCRTSLQYHRVKRETLLQGSGSVVLEIHRDGEVKEQALCEATELSPGTVHRLNATSDSDVVEVSSTELDDVVRLEDDYGRVDHKSADSV